MNDEQAYKVANASVVAENLNAAPQKVLRLGPQFYPAVSGGDVALDEADS